MERDSRTIVVVGASAGGVQALRELVAELPAQCDASILVVLHTGAGKSLLPNVLSRAGVMEATHAIQGEPLLPGHIYVAPPDHHMLIEGSHIQLTQGPRENHSRPAIDPLFRSAARAYGAQVVGVVLSGALSDGTSGLSMIKEHGGITIVQDPQDAIVEGMPTSALRVLEPDYVLPAFEIGRLLRRLVMRPVIGLGVSSMASDEAVGHGMTGYFQEQPDDQHSYGLGSGLFRLAGRTCVGWMHQVQRSIPCWHMAEHHGLFVASAGCSSLEWNIPVRARFKSGELRIAASIAGLCIDPSCRNRFPSEFSTVLSGLVKALAPNPGMRLTSRILKALKCHTSARLPQNDPLDGQ